MRGDGSLFRRGRVWWAVYYLEGRRIQESLGTDDPDVAARRLQKLRKAREVGTYLAPAERRVTVAELLDDLIVHLKVKGASSAGKVASHLKAVRLELGHIKAPSSTPRPSNGLKPRGTMRAWRRPRSTDGARRCARPTGWPPGGRRRRYGRSPTSPS